MGRYGTGSEERVEAEVLGGLGHGEEGVVARALLGLGEDAEIHGSILHSGVQDGAIGPRRAKFRQRCARGLAVPVTGPFGDRWLGRSRLVVAGA